MKKRVSLVSLLTALFVAMFASVSFAAGPDFQKLGFPTVVAEKVIQPGNASVITYGTVKIAIPADAFTAPVKFQVLEGPLAQFQAKAPAGETVLMDFAFKVTDVATGEIVGKFNKPVMFSYNNPKVNANSKYYDTTTDGNLVLNKIPAKIEGSTLSHPIAGAPVGWAVTSPATPINNSTSPVTGMPITPYVAWGAVLIGGGFLLMVVTRRRAN